jgi:hypothetical protein
MDVPKRDCAITEAKEARAFSTSFGGRSDCCLVIGHAETNSDHEREKKDRGR